MKNIIALVLLFLSLPSQASIYITVTGANVKRAKIAVGEVHPLPVATTTDPGLSKKIRDQVQQDLEFENLFDL